MSPIQTLDVSAAIADEALSGQRDLLVVSPLISGTDVLAVQERLATLGYSPGPLDGRYGVATAYAVQEFQRDHDLDGAGVLEPATRAALAGDLDSPRSDRLAASRTGKRALIEARKHLGTREQPAGSNRTSFGRWYGSDGVPWCAIFVSYCFHEGAGVTLCKGFKGAGVNRLGCAYVPTVSAWLRATGRWKGRSAPVPGDIAIFNWDGGVPDHIGIVESFLADGTFTCIEGNTSVGNDSNGGQVMRRKRHLNQVDGFGHIA
ncbi:peptidoglycan-binding protein [Solirubrobacter soli]|uniref:peptidoglycan-binding protein n=1 Tax=Solirubrobacter soli TaxID=363832 RepID=UPI00041DCB1D|nr:peptidoglycan-binding protein [Solirubrobacter soli]